MKSLIFKQYQEISSLLLISLLSLFFLSLRMKITHDYYLLFLVWNLFLAVLPYVISLWFSYTIELQVKKKYLQWATIPIISTWLLILPNSPYIITDLIHIKNAKGSWMIYDSILISCFAITGCWAGFKSIQQMIKILVQLDFVKKENNIKTAEYFILFLCALGIYLGRTLRWNSWDIIQYPNQLFIDTFAIFIDPLSHQTAWLQIAPMSIFLIVFYKSFTQYETKS